MKTKELLEKILMECVGHDEIRRSLNYICTVGEYAYATDCRVLLRIHKSLLDKVYNIPDDIGRYPKVEAVTGKINISHGSVDVSMLPSPDKDYNYNIGGRSIFSYEKYRKFYEVSLMLGVNEWNMYVGKTNRDGVMFQTEEDKVSMLLMPQTESKILCDIIPVCLPSTVGAHINLKNGAVFYDRIMKQREQEKEELQLQRKGNIFACTVARYATMYIEAKDEEEAWVIARRDCDDLDSDGFENPEPESMEYYGNVDGDDIDIEADEIYTMDGTVDIDDYFED